uniref:Carbonic anhydrase n=1 Tax=Oryzias latipes TaxID=8090 RepID=A0A3P9HWG6_ORYLA
KFILNCFLYADLSLFFSLLGHSWCYEGHLCDYAPSNWSILPEAKCGGEQQSPINIDTQSTTEDESLGAFTFLNFDDKHAIESITNTGHSVQCNINGSVEVSGGGLPHDYTVLQFHFHWGSVASDGSEHLLDSKRFPMEMHIVCIRKDLNRSEALAQSDGLAVLGFFIEVKSRAYYLLLNKYSQVPFSDEISIDDLLGNVDRHSYFRYNGSLTTPQCNEAVVWTVFKESIKVNQNLVCVTLRPLHGGARAFYMRGREGAEDFRRGVNEKSRVESHHK